MRRDGKRNEENNRRLVNWVLLGLGGWLCLLQGCVSPYDANVQLSANLVVVNGIITDQIGTQTIFLSRARSSADSSATTPIQRAAVTLAVNGENIVTLREVQPGEYQLPDGFVGKVGNTYQLRFRTEEGIAYQSSVETMTGVSAILRTYDTYNPLGPKKTADALPTPVNDIYVDFQDPAGARNFYLWRWRLYETQRWCATCEQGRYVVQDIGPLGSGPLMVLGCVRDTTLPTRNLFDYPCRGLCWDIFYNQDIDVFADSYTNGQLQVGHKVASVPIYQLDKASITIEQLSLSADAYRYYKLFAEQTQNTGTLADSPPAPIAGNVRNQADPTENVVGYFSAASVSISSHRIVRSNVPASAGRFQGLFNAVNGRMPNLETGRNGGQGFSGVSSAVCIPSRSRTDQVPPGW
jgi:hypothetical protein